MHSNGCATKSDLVLLANMEEMVFTVQGKDEDELPHLGHVIWMQENAVLPCCLEMR